MAYLESSRRVGRSQGASIFWGLVSVFFAAAACYYYWKNHENETSANVLRDQVLNLQEQRETLSSQKDKLQAGISETENQLKTREELLEQGEKDLADKQNELELLDRQSQSVTEQDAAQARVIKKFNDVVRKLATDGDTDVVVRGGRPVLRIPSSVFFAFGDATLKPEGKAVLKQIADNLQGQLGDFELRIDAFTDSEGEIAAPDTTDKAAPGKPGTKPDDKTKPADDASMLHYASGWELTAARSGAIAKYFREQTSLPFQNVIITPRADFQPIVASGREGHARNRRIEITIAPQPAVFHSPDLLQSPADGKGQSSAHSLAPPPDKPAKKKEKASR